MRVLRNQQNAGSCPGAGSGKPRAEAPIHRSFPNRAAQDINPIVKGIDKHIATPVNPILNRPHNQRVY